MIDELRAWADWCVSCACGGKSIEVEAAYWAIDEIERLRSENDRLREGYKEAIEDIEDWASYADQYFKDKWGLNECVAKHKEALK